MGALRAMAIADSNISALVTLAEANEHGPAGTHVYANRIPRAVIEACDVEQPAKILVLRQAGGAGKADILPVTNVSFDALCYGETQFEADRLLRVVTQRCITLDRETFSDVLIHHINTTGGPIPSDEPELRWPAVAQGFTTLADILEVA